MTERELIAKLNNLQNVKPDDSWKTSHREILLAQVQNTSGDSRVSGMENFWMVTRNVFASVPQFAWASMAIVLFLTTGIFFGDRLPVGPNNSLYIARVISERARLSTMFDGAAKSRLTAQYASGHARDIASTLSNNISDESQVAKLNDTFKTEIAKAKENLPVAENNINKDDEVVTIADSEVATTGLTVYTPAGEGTETPVVSSTPPVEIKKDAKLILDEAEKLFNAKDYAGALDKLKEADEVIKQ